MRVQPFSFIKEPIGVTPTPSGAPFTEDMVFWFKDANTNVSSGFWLDSSPNTTPGVRGQLFNGAAVDGGSNSVRMNNTSSSPTARNQYIGIKPQTGSATIQSFLMVFNQPLSMNATGTSRHYLYDPRDAQTPSNAGFINQVDSLSTLVGSCHRDATFFAHSEANGTSDLGTLTQAVITDGTGNSLGGNDWWQFLGTAGRNSNTDKRVFFWNYNPLVPITINNNREPWYIATNSSGNEGTNMGVFTMIAYNRLLTYSEYLELIQYLKDTGVINP